MIEINNIIKSYDDHTALKGLSLSMRENELFGMVGTNGAGKTTLMRIMTGIMKADSGEVQIDGLPVWDNPAAKQLFFFIPEEPYFYPNCRPRTMAEYYAGIYENFSMEHFLEMMGRFGLDLGRRVNGYSKGMKRQLAIILGLSARTKYLFCDETFDGLDPVMRQATKSLMAQAMEDRGLATVLTSHNLRELEDVCDHVGLLHQGGVLLSENLDDLKLGVQKLQVVFESEEDRQAAEQQLAIMDHRTQGRLHVYTVRQSAAETEGVMKGAKTVWFELLPLTLEEIFISETEVVGYDIQKIIGE
ncbi:MAG: ABC transporter ATP-binding protein [Lachnospiraceae bacterium]|nr:ABC transporter ATP-binding protein [Lachnospiraceae bacterium]